MVFSSRKKSILQKKIDELMTLKISDMPDEETVVSRWCANYREPVVSIICNTFNHERYIEDALKGFLLQKTDFPFEIIVHDDASNDNTSNIIARYRRQYPNIIKTIIQSENQFSKGHKPSCISFPASSGRFIAICEGDDFWIDPLKLSLQKSALERSPNVDMCVHPAYATNCNGRIVGAILNESSPELIDPSVVIASGGAWCATSSIFVRREVMKRFTEDFKDAPIGDLFIQCLGAFRGGCVVVPRFSSIYRMGVPGNWSGGRGKGGRLDSYHNVIQKCLSRLAEYPHASKYHDQINLLKSRASYSTSVDFLRLRDYEKFCKYISKSVRYKFGLSFRQLVLFFISIPLYIVFFLNK